MNPLHFLWKDSSLPSRYRAGVSLHSHTLHSRESLDFIPRLAAHNAPLRRLIHSTAGQFERAHGLPLNFSNGWWTPPLGPAQAIALESSQIANLGLRPLISITDHDTLAPLPSPAAVHSVELTVPIANSFLHLGIHNLPPSRAAEVLAYGNHPSALLAWLARFPAVLVVLNHPLWDEAGVGVSAHRAMVERFLARNQGFIHALELNGLRPWSENRQVIDMANAWDLPLISGGDRHGLEPSANINLTDALTFDLFVEEVRYERVSRVLFLPQYRRPFAARIAANVLDILQDHPGHPLGHSAWSDRVFYELRPGLVRSLSSYWAAGEPSLVRLFIALATLLRASGPLSPIRIASGLLSECQP